MMILWSFDNYAINLQYSACDNKEDYANKKKMPMKRNINKVSDVS